MSKIREIRKRIGVWKKRFPSNQYIFRGQNNPCSAKPEVSSSLYRQMGRNASPKKLLEQEREILVFSRQRSLPYMTDVEILSDIQHFGGATNCIDFTCEVEFALFFACSDEKAKNEDAELIFMRYDDLPLTHAVDFQLSSKGDTAKDLELVIPSPSDMDKNRALFQRSLFVRDHKGWINVSPRCYVETIKANDKDEILSVLAEYGVSHPYLFKDVLSLVNLGLSSAEGDGWLQSIQKSRFGLNENKQPRGNYNLGIWHYCREDYHEALQHFDNYIQPGVTNYKAYSFRGSIHFRRGHYEKVIADVNRIGEKDWTDRDCFLLAMAYYKLGRVSCALKAVEAAIDFNPYRAIYHHLRVMLEAPESGQATPKLPASEYLARFEKDATVARLASEKRIAVSSQEERWQEDFPDNLG